MGKKTFGACSIRGAAEELRRRGAEEPKRLITPVLFDNMNGSAAHA
jgi:hypothetical protein